MTGAGEENMGAWGGWSCAQKGMCWVCGYVCVWAMGEVGVHVGCVCVCGSVHVFIGINEGNMGVCP